MRHRIVDSKGPAVHVYNPRESQMWLTEQQKRNISFESLLNGRLMK